MKFLLLIGSVAAIIAGLFLIPRENSAISPTAYYTGHVWLRNGLSDTRLATIQGRILYYILEPFMRLSKFRNDGPTIEESLLARHTVIDLLLEERIESGNISHVIEIAAGMSPRGLRFANKYGSNITYIELDLPSMAEHKKRVITASLSPHHIVDTVDALAGDGENSLSYVLNRAKPPKGVIVVTEGLVNYFDQQSLENIWSNIALGIRQYSGTGSGFYLSDIHLDSPQKSRSETLFKNLLQVFVRGKVHLHYSGVDSAVAGLQRAGFVSAEVRLPRQWVGEDKAAPLHTSPGAELVSIIVAHVM
jgi:O-methyltransferase involved in polyketide biosynthesis